MALHIKHKRLGGHGDAREDLAGAQGRAGLVQVAHRAGEELRGARAAASRPATEVDDHRMLLGQLDQRRPAAAPEGGHARTGEGHINAAAGLSSRLVAGLLDR